MGKRQPAGATKRVKNRQPDHCVSSCTRFPYVRLCGAGVLADAVKELGSFLNKASNRALRQASLSTLVELTCTNAANISAGLPTPHHSSPLTPHLAPFSSLFTHFNRCVRGIIPGFQEIAEMKSGLRISIFDCAGRDAGGAGGAGGAAAVGRRPAPGAARPVAV